MNESQKGEVVFDAENHNKIMEYQRAQRLVLNDAPKENVDAIFLHPLSYGNDNEMFPFAAKMLADGKARYIVINGSQGEKIGGNIPGEAWAGKDVYIKRLKKKGVKEEQIIVAGSGMHTRESNDRFLEVAREHNFKSAVTLNQPEQLLRATLGQIKSMKNQNYLLRLYSAYPEPWEANKKVRGNQGAEPDRRYKMLPTDFERIKTYQAKGDIASYQEFYKYMSEREKIH
jgi:hypothetical protein